MSTVKDIRDYAHFYIGCNLERGGKLTAGLIQACNDAVFEAWGDIKPILRPLSDAKMEDAHFIADEMEIITSNVFAWLQSALNGGLTQFDRQVQFINLLRKREFDTDGLIDAGLAIDKTKLP